VQAHGLDFIRVCKPTSHPIPYEGVEDLERTGGVMTLTCRRWTGKRHETETDRDVNTRPLRDADDAS